MPATFAVSIALFMAAYQFLGWKKLLVKLDQLRTRHIKHRNFIIILSFLVGVLSALAAVLMKVSVQFVEHQADRLNHAMNSNILTAFFPLIGTALSLLLLQKVFGGQLTRGVSIIIEYIKLNKSRVPRQHILGHMVTSAVTIAFGGSVGLEAPIVSTGAAIGSNTATGLRLGYRDTTLLLACGTASGIAAIFNSPIAGIIFALEVLMIDFNIPFFIPLLISTATATVVSQVLYPDKFVFMMIQGWEMKAIPFYVLLGAACGMVSIYITGVVERTEHFFQKQKKKWHAWLLAGLPLCLLILILPGLYGEGYNIVLNLLRGQTDVLTKHSFLSTLGGEPYVVIIACCFLIALKPLSAALTVSAGGNGGVFAPSLIIGGILGFVFAYILNLTGFISLRTPNFIIAAMAGVLAGVMHAPLTAIFLLAEITGGYALFIPLMIVTASSYFMTRKHIRFSIYHKPLTTKGLLDPDQPRDHI
jgi:chloride channel protein, CIC family